MVLNVIATRSFLVRDSLDLQEFFQTPLSVEAALDTLSVCMLSCWEGRDSILPSHSA